MSTKKPASKTKAAPGKSDTKGTVDKSAEKVTKKPAPSKKAEKLDKRVDKVMAKGKPKPKVAVKKKVELATTSDLAKAFASIPAAESTLTPSKVKPHTAPNEMVSAPAPRPAAKSNKNSNKVSFDELNLNGPVQSYPALFGMFKTRS